MSLLVSIHDVTPALAEGVERLWALCAVRALRPALLVVPDWHGAWPLESHPDFVGWLRMFDPRKGYWRYVRTNTSPTRYLYDYDEDGPTQSIDGQQRSGFRILFNPAAK